MVCFMESESEKLVMVHSTVRSKGDKPDGYDPILLTKNRDVVIRATKESMLGWQDRFGSMAEQHQQLK